MPYPYKYHEKVTVSCIPMDLLNYIAATCQAICEKEGIKSRKYKNIAFSTQAIDIMLMCSTEVPGYFNVVILRTDKKGDPQDPEILLQHHIESGGFSEESHIGKCNVAAMLESNRKTTETSPYFALFESIKDRIIPCYGTDKKGRRFMFQNGGVALQAREATGMTTSRKNKPLLIEPSKTK